MTKQELQAWAHSFEQLNVLVVGDVMIDSYFWGKVDRISPEAPVPVVQVQKRENRLGGAANVALNIQALGAKAIICSVVGHDTNGDLLRTSLQHNQFTTEGIVDSTERITTVKTRVMSQGHHLLRVDEEITTPLSATDEQHLLDCVRGILDRHPVHAIIFEDYNKGVLTPKVIETVIEWAKQMSIPTTVDPKRDHFFAYRGVTMFKPNLKELQEGMKVDLKRGDVDAIAVAVEHLRKQLDAESVMVTLSEYGVISANAQAHVHHAAHPREILDVSGAGDTVIAVATLCLAAGCDVHQAATLSNLAGGLVCEKVGVVPIDMQRWMNEALSRIVEGENQSA
ncbi:MAG: D-glycero-beta-D-manno-heptose-7-phosphate kinase [Flavobacteriales bacterium]